MRVSCGDGDVRSGHCSQSVSDADRPSFLVSEGAMPAQKKPTQSPSGRPTPPGRHPPSHPLHCLSWCVPCSSVTRHEHRTDGHSWSRVSGTSGRRIQRRRPRRGNDPRVVTPDIHHHPQEITKTVWMRMVSHITTRVRRGCVYHQHGSVSCAARPLMGRVVLNNASPRQEAGCYARC